MAENIEIDADAENFILDICTNTIKILINYMEKFKLLNQLITFELANNICTNISFFSFQTYTDYLKDGKLVEAINILYSIYDKGYSVMDILDNYFFPIFNNRTSLTKRFNIISVIIYTLLFKAIYM